ncbi:MAG: LysR family transcriptional regulator [Armatimonadota bacterium]|nr:LysR family transcriptional regulator [Armatimonadota bacterium]
MNLHQLRIFYTVARLGSFSRAAEELRISQPSVSIQVADLERSLGVELFEQLGRRIYLTEAGRVLEEYARRILSLAEEARAALDDVRGMRRGRLALGASMTPGAYILPRALGAYQERYPQVVVTLEIAPARRIQEKLARNELDLGVVGAEAVGPDLAAEPLVDDELILVTHPAHPLAAAGIAHVRGLRDHRLILRERGSGTREVVEAAFREVGVQVPVHMELSSIEAIKEAVAAGAGATILSRFAVAADLAAGRLAAVPLADLTIRRRFVLVRHRDKRLTQVAAAFVEVLREVVAAPAGA